jgi:glycerol-3-phosphate acyltransferase PlsX
MGGDDAPLVVVAGAVNAVRNHGVPVTLVGPEAVVRDILRGFAPLPAGLDVRHAPQVVGMGEHPSNVLRQQTESSIAVGIDMVRDGAADAFVSAGNTGAVMAFALLHLGRLPGVERPALGTTFPTRRGRCLLLDAGANADCRPSYLVQFAHMGLAYSRRVLGVAAPTVGLLNIGEEPSKGSQFTLEVHQLLQASGLPFAGNVEGKDVTRGAVDVVVTDGFTGNVAIKVAEGVAEFVTSLLRESLTSSWHVKLLAGLLRPALRSVGRRLDYAETGGAPLLGVNGVVVVAHGRSNARAIENAILVAARSVEGGLLEAITAGLPVPAARNLRDG